MLTSFVNRVHNFVDWALGLGLGLDRVAEEGKDDEDGCAEEGDKDAEDDEDEAEGAFGLVVLLLAVVAEEDAGDERREDEQGEVEDHGITAG